jgi:hypothetical protein
MAIPFLNNINLDDNQLLNAKLQVTSSAPTAAAGQIYFDSTTGTTTAKYYDGSAWISLIDHTFNNGTYINLTEAGTDATRTLTADLSAVDGTAGAGERYLTKSNTWATVASIPGTYTWDVSDGTNTDTVGSGFELIFAGTGGTTTSYNSGNRTLTIDSGNETITLTGEVTGSGTTSISTTVANGVLDVANFNASAIVIESEGIENNDNDTTLPTSAAVKAYVDSSVAGGLIYQGGYNAATNTPDLTTSPNSILKGWTYTVTADGAFFGEQLRVGDVLIAEQDNPSALANWTTVQNNIDLASLTQVGIGNVNAGDAIDVSYSSGTATVSAEDSTASNKGVIIVSESTDTEFVGVDVRYDAPGEVEVGLNINGMTEETFSSAIVQDTFIPYYNDQNGENHKVQVSDLLALASSQTSFAATITDTATITHGLGTKDVIVQLYDVTTNETVYADVDRISTTQVTITFATTPTNSIRVLVQKIG